MADLNSFTSMQPGTVEAYGGILKTLMSLNPIVGGIITIVSAYFINKNTKVTKTNTEVTKTNTAAKEVTPEAIEKFKADLLAFNESFKTETVTEIKAVIAQHKSDSKKELDVARVTFMRVYKQAHAQLSMRPSVDQAIEDRLLRSEKVLAEVVNEIQGGKKK